MASGEHDKPEELLHVGLLYQSRRFQFCFSARISILVSLGFGERNNDRAILTDAADNFHIQGVSQA